MITLPSKLLSLLLVLATATLVAQSIPTDPIERFSGFTPRIGTWVDADAPKFWNFDNENRADAQDAFYRIYQPAVAATATSAFSWVEAPNYTTGSGGVLPATHRQAVIRVLNLARYITDDVAAVYGQENSAMNPASQAAAFLFARNNKLSHSPDSSWVGYNALAAEGARANLALNEMGAVSVFGYISDPGAGNANVGHRSSILSNGGSVSVGDFYQSGMPVTNVIRVDNRTADPRGGDPVDYLQTWPARGYMAYNWVDAQTAAKQGEGFRVGVQLRHGASARFDEASIVVTRNGVPVMARVVYTDTTRVVFEIPLTDFAQAPASDVVYNVRISGLVFDYPVLWQSPNLSPRDPAPPPAGTYETARSFSWSFTVYDPAQVVKSDWRNNSPIVGLSTRSRIGGGDKVMISGFAIDGDEPMRVVVRATGQSMEKYGVSDYARNPKVTLYRHIGSETQTVGAIDNWQDESSWRMVQSIGFAPDAANEAVAIATLPPGVYTAVAEASADGVGLVEVYGVDGLSTSALTSVSTRGQVGTGADILIGGVAIKEERTLVFRSQGPSLAAYGVTGTVPDTVVRVYRDSELIATNDDWDAAGNERLKGDLAWMAPSNAKEAALVMRLPAGAYTVQVSGKGDSTGVGIVEIYEVANK